MNIHLVSILPYHFLDFNIIHLLSPRSFTYADRLVIEAKGFVIFRPLAKDIWIDREVFKQPNSVYVCMYVWMYV